MKIKIIKEVYSDRQRRFMCAMSKQGADRPDGLSKKEAEEMCDGPMKKEEKLDELSGAGGVAGAPVAIDKEELDEMFSSAAVKSYGELSIGDMPEEEHAGHVERSKYQGLRNVMEKTKASKVYKLRIKP